MRLRTVTLSGADDRVRPTDLVEWHRRFPFAEWGILLSPTAHGKPRYPSSTRIEELIAVSEGTLRLSGHLCGSWAKAVCRGQFPPDVDASRFGRIQLNIARYIDGVESSDSMAACLPRGREYILQVGSNVEPGLDLARRLRNAGVDASVLFDASGGHGVTPEQWPELPDDVPCGFAGGLGPDNLGEQLERLAAVVGDRTIWIDMESRIRSESDEFDLGKVTRCLQIAQGYVG